MGKKPRSPFTSKESGGEHLSHPLSTGEENRPSCDESSDRKNVCLRQTRDEFRGRSSPKSPAPRCKDPGAARRSASSSFQCDPR
jgi:hypothetical protein